MFLPGLVSRLVLMVGWCVVRWFVDGEVDEG
jgi:hypothetical protein